MEDWGPERGHAERGTREGSVKGTRVHLESGPKPTQCGPAGACGLNLPGLPTTGARAEVQATGMLEQGTWTPLGSPGRP